MLTLPTSELTLRTTEAPCPRETVLGPRFTLRPMTLLSRPGMNQPPAGTDAQATLEGIRGVGVSQGPGLQPVSTSLEAEGARADSGDIALAPG